MKKIILIRHGETQWNVDRKFQGKTDIPLSVAGKEQGKRLAERMRDIPIDCIYSSPLQRAAATAQLIAQEKGISVNIEKELIEADFGRWEGLTLQEIEAAYPEEFAACRKDPVANGFRYGLTFDDMQNQVDRFIANCITDSPGENIAVVSHNVILKMLLITLLDMPRRLIHSFYLDNCSISVILLSDAKRILLKFNDNTHISMGIDYRR